VVQLELERMQGLQPEYLFHDEFSQFYDPVYFHQFVERAARHELQYLAEAAFPATCVVQASLLGQRDLAGLGTVEGEQILDFKVFRNFRATLLCHQRVKVDRALEPARVHSLYVSSPVQADSPAPEIASSKEETFRSATRKRNLKVTTNNPLSKAALSYLGRRWPDRVAFEELKVSAFELARFKPQQDLQPSLEEMVLTMYAGELAELHTHRPELPDRVSERPFASPLARLMLREGNYATNLRHEGVDLDHGLRQLVLLLDGTRDRNALLQAMDDGSFARAEAPSDSQKSKEEKLEENLQEIYRMALLSA
jgi:methyltransferase-like protein